MSQLLETYVGKKLMATGLLIGWKIITMNKRFSAHYPGGLVDPIDFFQLLFDDEVINLLVLETNRYAEQFFTNFPGRLSEKYYQEWQPCTPARMKAYLGILIHMGLSQLHHMQSH